MPRAIIYNQLVIFYLFFIATSIGITYIL